MNAASAIMEARKQAGLTQTALARRAGTSQATLSAYESGAKSPSLRTLSRLLASSGVRLTTETAPGLHVLAPDRQAETARKLLDVIALAEALPVKHEQELPYPPLHDLIR